MRKRKKGKGPYKPLLFLGRFVSDPTHLDWKSKLGLGYRNNRDELWKFILKVDNGIQMTHNNDCEIFFSPQKNKL